MFSLERKQFGKRGGLPYHKPAGWVRYAVEADRDALRNWHVAYHGTSLPNALKIAATGLRRPGSPGVSISHGQAYSKSGRSMYVTPSLGYAAFPVYAPLLPIDQPTGSWLQAVVQVRVRPGYYEPHQGTLGGKYWPQGLGFDPDFHGMEDLEYILEDEKHCVVTGVLLRVLGQRADPSVYGDFAARVGTGEKGPEYELRRLMVDEMLLGRGRELEWDSKQASFVEGFNLAIAAS